MDRHSSTSQQSYLANLALIAGAAHYGGDYFTMSENVRCARGNDSLARALAADIDRQGGEIHLSSPVASITIGSDKVTVTPEGGKPTMGAYVVLAIPPSVWPGEPSVRLVIEPPIPDGYRMTMGLAVKYLEPHDASG